MKLSAMKTDLTKAKEGIWVEGIPDFQDLRLKVRPSNNPDFRRVYSQLVDAVPRQHKRGGLIVDHKIKGDIMARAMAETVLVGWENYEDDKGKPIPFSIENAKATLLDPELLAFRDAVSWAAEVANGEVLGVAEENAGN